MLQNAWEQTFCHMGNTLAAVVESACSSLCHRVTLLCDLLGKATVCGTLWRVNAFLAPLRGIACVVRATDACPGHGSPPSQGCAPSQACKATWLETKLSRAPCKDAKLEKELVRLHRRKTNMDSRSAWLKPNLKAPEVNRANAVAIGHLERERERRTGDLLLSRPLCSVQRLRYRLRRVTSPRPIAPNMSIRGSLQTYLPLETCRT